MGTVTSINKVRERRKMAVFKDDKYLLTFDAERVKTLFDHAKSAANHRCLEPMTAGEYGLYLVASQQEGCYLMSTGEPGLKADGTIAEPGEINYDHYVAFANGFAPTDDGWYKRKLEVYGAHYSVDLIPLPSVQRGICPTAKTFELGITEAHIYVLPPAL
jgi:hypothetical protein